MSEHRYRLNPITGAVVPVDDAAMYTVVTSSGKELFTLPRGDGKFIIDYNI